MEKEPFWKVKSLWQLNKTEWELLCDGCGKCCLHKIEDVDSGMVYTTDVACRLLDIETCQCKDYQNRERLVNDCVALTPAMMREIHWLPKSCAYRRLADGRGLAWWHPLVSGDPNTVIQAGISIFGKVVSEEKVNSADIEERVVDWFD
jgi:uncharacterized cysteine cluster protein YcgN (CxxCxxCC family)